MGTFFILATPSLSNTQGPYGFNLFRQAQKRADGAAEVQDYLPKLRLKETKIALY